MSAEIEGYSAPEHFSNIEAELEAEDQQLKAVVRQFLAEQGLDEGNALRYVLETLPPYRAESIVQAITQSPFFVLGRYVDHSSDNPEYKAIEQGYIRQVVACLSQEPVALSIENYTDAETYLELIQPFVEQYLDIDSEGYIQAGINKATTYTATDFTAAVNLLTRHAYSEDLKTDLGHVGAMAKNLPARGGHSITTELSQMSQFIQSSEDIKELDHLVEVMASAVNVSTLEFRKIFGLNGNLNGIKTIDQETTTQFWSNYSGNVGPIHKILPIIEAAYKYGRSDAFDTLRGWMAKSLTNPERFEQLLPYAQAGIPPQFIERAKAMGELENIDLSQPDIHKFESTRLKLRWLEHIAYEWVDKPEQLPELINYFESTWNIYSGGNGPEDEEPDMEEVQLSGFAYSSFVDFVGLLSSHGHVDSIIQVKNSGYMGEQVVTNFDLQFSSSVNIEDAITLVKFLVDNRVKEVMPKTWEKAKRIVAESKYNIDVAEYFIENLHLMPNEEWVKDCALEAATINSVADKILYQGYEFSGVEWKEELYQAAKETEDIAKAEFAADMAAMRTEDVDLSEDNPYVDHPLRFTPEQFKLVYQLFEVSRSRIDPDGLTELSFTSEVIQKVEQISVMIEEVFHHWCNSPEFQHRISKVDQQAIQKPGEFPFNLQPLQTRLELLALRYVVQLAKGDAAAIPPTLDNLMQPIEKPYSSYANSTGLSEVIEAGLTKFVQAHEVDINHYDLLYEQLDKLREEEGEITEVYLARDGLYAAMGRKGQDQAKRHVGQILKWQPTAEQPKPVNRLNLVYPRFIRDSMTVEAKTAWLNQHLITPDTNPYFYDTGYTGTIPEQIMKLQGFDDAEIDKRILLLSSQPGQESRRVEGMTENARGDIIERIEHNAKLEESATGLYVDPTNGEIGHIAEPTSPEEQFYYLMIQEAITRHYKLKEYLKHRHVFEARENLNQPEVGVPNLAVAAD